MTEPKKPIRVLICGSREWTDIAMIEREIKVIHEKHGIEKLIHGDCRGADVLAESIGHRLGISVEAYPAFWVTHGPAAGPKRNAEMLRDGKPDMVLAFTYDLWHSDGTRDMVNPSVRAKLPVYWYPYRLKIEREIVK